MWIALPCPVGSVALDCEPVVAVALGAPDSSRGRPRGRLQSRSRGSGRGIGRRFAAFNPGVISVITVMVGPPQTTPSRTSASESMTCLTR
jgi:hypothetical protein